MKTILIICSLFLCCNLSAQIIEGQVAIYSKGHYSMDTEEGWARVEANGGLNYNRRGYIYFMNDGIIFVIGSTEVKKEIYNSYTFRYKDEKKTTLINSSSTISTNFFLLDSEGSQNPLMHISGNYFKNNKGVFIFSNYSKSKMYFLMPFKNESEIVENIYNKN